MCGLLVVIVWSSSSHTSAYLHLEIQSNTEGIDITVVHVLCIMGNLCTFITYYMVWLILRVLMLHLWLRRLTSLQAMLPHIAVADGEYKTRSEPLIDLLLAEDQVKECPESLLTSMLLAAIKDGEQTVEMWVHHYQMYRCCVRLNLTRLS